MVVAKKWIFAKQFDGFPKEGDLKLEEETLPALKDGEILVEAVCWSVDPYMRPYTKRLPTGIVMIGEQVCRVVESKSADHKVGSMHQSYLGWRTHSVVAGPALKTLKPLPDLGDMSTTLALGALGMPGATAYFGLLELCAPQKGETVLVNGAAGAVGSVVGQIAKIKGCRVIGYAGDEAKCDWLKKDLGFDEVFNYKKVSIAESLKKAAPDGVDCFFDNVGGEFTNTALMHMKKRGRIAVCGAISTYNDATGASSVKSPFPYGAVVGNELKIEGFLVPRWDDRRQEAVSQLTQWVKEGKLKARETITEGFEKMPEAFMGLFTGSNTGKAVVKATGTTITKC